MLNVSKWGTKGTLTKQVGKEDDKLPLRHGDVGKFRVPDDDYFFATLWSNSKFEHVKVMGIDGSNLLVVRGQDNTEAQSWPVDTCVRVEWNPEQLCGFAKQCVNNEGKSGVNPGTYCMSCDTCLDVDETGRITKITGGEGC